MPIIYNLIKSKICKNKPLSHLHVLLLQPNKIITKEIREVLSILNKLEISLKMLAFHKMIFFSFQNLLLQSILSFKFSVIYKPVKNTSFIS